MTAPTSLGSKGVHDGPVKKRSRKNSCLKCHDGGIVLFCNSSECSVVIHESCMSCVARFDGFGNFYCPYCLYKQTFEQCRQAKEQALLAKKALASFLDMATTSNISKTLKRKQPDSCGNTQNQNGDCTNKVETDDAGNQDIQVEFGKQDDCRELKKLAGVAQHEVKPDGQENIKTVETYHGRKDVREQTPAEVQEASILLIRKENSAMHEESDNANGIAFRNNCILGHQTSTKSNPRTNVGQGGVKSPKEATFPKKKERALMIHEETEKHHETGKTVEYEGEGVEKKQHRREPQRASICLTGKDDMVQTHEESDKGNDSTVGDEYFLKMTIPVDSKNHNQPAGTEAAQQGREDDRETQVALQRSAVHNAKEHVLSQSLEESGNSAEKHQKTAKTVEDHRGVEDKLTEAQAEVSSFCLRRKDSVMERVEESEKDVDITFRDACLLRSQMALNSESSDQSAEVGEDPCGRIEKETTLRSLRNDIRPTREDSESGIHNEPRISTKRNLETAKKVEEHHRGGVEKQRRLKEASVCMVQKDTTAEKHEEYDHEIHKIDYLDRNETAVDSENVGKFAEIGEDHQERTNGEQIQVKLPKIHVLPRKDGYSLTHEESHSGNNDVSSQDSCCTGSGVRSKRKIKRQKNLDNADLRQESNKSSECEVSETEDEATNGRRRQKEAPVKQIQRTTLQNARRRKLPWTVEEIEMLKEGVQKFSLVANKNLPWMKILESGRHIFDGTRTPADLKDKWRNLMGRGHATSNRK